MGSVKDTLQAYGSGAIHIMRRFRGLCADGPGSLRRYFNLPRQSLSIRRAAAPHPASWGRSLRTRRCAPQGKHEARLVFEIPGVSPLKRKRHSLQTHTITWSSSLARLAAAAAMATLTAAALVAVTLVAAAAPGQQRELSLQCWRQLAAAAGGGGWRRHCWRQHAGAALLWRRGGGVAAPCRSRPARIALAVCRRGRRIRMRPPRRQTVGWPQSRKWVKSVRRRGSNGQAAALGAPLRPRCALAPSHERRPW